MNSVAHTLSLTTQTIIAAATDDVLAQACVDEISRITTPLTASFDDTVWKGFAALSDNDGWEARAIACHVGHHASTPEAYAAASFLYVRAATQLADSGTPSEARYWQQDIRKIVNGVDRRNVQQPELLLELAEQYKTIEPAYAIALAQSAEQYLDASTTSLGDFYRNRAVLFTSLGANALALEDAASALAHTPPEDRRATGIDFLFDATLVAAPSSTADASLLTFMEHECKDSTQPPLESNGICQMSARLFLDAAHSTNNQTALPTACIMERLDAGSLGSASACFELLTQSPEQLNSAERITAIQQLFMTPDVDESALDTLATIFYNRGQYAELDTLAASVLRQNPERKLSPDIMGKWQFTQGWSAYRLNQFDQAQRQWWSSLEGIDTVPHRLTCAPDAAAESHGCDLRTFAALDILEYQHILIHTKANQIYTYVSANREVDVDFQQQWLALYRDGFASPEEIVDTLERKFLAVDAIAEGDLKFHPKRLDMIHAGFAVIDTLTSLATHDAIFRPLVQKALLAQQDRLLANVQQVLAKVPRLLPIDAQKHLFASQKIVQETLRNSPAPAEELIVAAMQIALWSNPYADINATNPEHRPEAILDFGMQVAMHFLDPEEKLFAISTPPGGEALPPVPKDPINAGAIDPALASQIGQFWHEKLHTLTESVKTSSTTTDVSVPQLNDLFRGWHQQGLDQTVKELRKRLQEFPENILINALIVASNYTEYWIDYRLPKGVSDNSVDAQKARKRIAVGTLLAAAVSQEVVERYPKNAEGMIEVGRMIYNDAKRVDNYARASDIASNILTHIRTLAATGDVPDETVGDAERMCIWAKLEHARFSGRGDNVPTALEMLQDVEALLAQADKHVAVPLWRKDLAYAGAKAYYVRNNLEEGRRVWRAASGYGAQGAESVCVPVSKFGAQNPRSRALLQKSLHWFADVERLEHRVGNVPVNHARILMNFDQFAQAVQYYHQALSESGWPKYAVNERLITIDELIDASADYLCNPPPNYPESCTVAKEIVQLREASHPLYPDEKEFQTLLSNAKNGVKNFCRASDLDEK